MSESLSFQMGKHLAEIPADLIYARNHMWAQRKRFGSDGQPELRFGLTAYAVRLLQDVYFLDWIVAPGSGLDWKQEIGQIESQKAEASLYAPIAGQLIRLNEELLRDPSAINVDPYGAGWMFEMSGSEQMLLAAGDYLEHLAAVWEVTQQTIKAEWNR